MNWLVIFVIVCVGLFGFIGYKRGLIKSMISIVATILALVLSYLLTPIVCNVLENHTAMGRSIENKMYTLVQDKVKETVGGTEAQVEELMKQNPSKQDQVSLIKELRIPDFLEETLLANNNSQGYKELGVDNVYRYVAKTATHVIINIIAGIITFVLIRLMLWVAVILISSAAKKFALLNLVDKTGGVVAGVIFGFLIVWVVMFVTSLLMDGDTYTNLLKDNSGLQWLHDHNILMKISLR